MTKQAIFNYMNETAKAVDDYIISKLTELEKEDKNLYEIVSHLVLLRKYEPKLRSTLGRLIYEILGGENWHEIVPVLGFIELSTISSYVLDDIIDDQPERDGEVATWKKFGLNYGIIAGSLQSFISIMMLNDLKIDDAKKLKIIDLANRIWEILWKGEGKNEHMKDGTTVEEYIERCYEIAGIMWETVAKISAILCNAGNEKINFMAEIGKIFGIAVMIRNDLTSFLPEELMKEKSKALSRKSFEDVRKGIWTYPIICAMKNAGTEDKARINKLLGKNKATEEELIELTKLLIKMGCIDSTLDLITSYKLKGLEYVNKLDNSDSKIHLTELFELLENTKEYVNKFKKRN